MRDGAWGNGVRGLGKMLRALPSAVQFARTRLHVALLLAFLGGRTTGPLLYLTYGASALALPVVVLLLLAVLDVSPAGAYVSPPLPPQNTGVAPSPVREVPPEPPARSAPSETAAQR